MSNIQKLEEQIFACWQVTNDLEEVFAYFYECDVIDKDKLANILLGLKEIYNIKFENTYNTYEQLVKDYYNEKSVPVSE